MAAGKGYFVVSIAFLLFFLVSVCCLPEPGKKDLHFKMVSNICFRCSNSPAEYCILCPSLICWWCTVVSLFHLGCGFRFVYVLVLKIDLKSHCNVCLQNQTLDIFAKTMNKGYSIAIGGWLIANTFITLV